MVEVAPETVFQVAPLSVLRSQRTESAPSAAAVKTAVAPERAVRDTGCRVTVAAGTFVPNESGWATSWARDGIHVGSEPSCELKLVRKQAVVRQSTASPPEGVNVSVSLAVTVKVPSAPTWRMYTGLPKTLGYVVPGIAMDWARYTPRPGW